MRSDDVSNAGKIYECAMYALGRDGEGGFSPYLPIRWTYRTSDPFAISMIFTGEEGDLTEWHIARDLIATGVVSDKPYGVGDVVTWRVDDTLFITLHNDEGKAELIMPRRKVMKFLKEIYDAVPEGFELNHVNIDEAIESLLA